MITDINVQKLAELIAELDRLRAENARLAGEVEKLRKPRMYPIQKGPSVPWDVLVPHESRCQKNHSQSIDRIAERGGFSPSEAYCIVTNLDRDEMEKTIGHKEAENRWIEYAERINNHYNDLQRHKSALEKAREALDWLVGHYDAKDVEHLKTLHPGRAAGENSVKDVLLGKEAISAINEVLK